MSRVAAPVVTIQPTQYLVTMLPLDCEEATIWSLMIEWAGQPYNAPLTDRVWAVRRMRQCLSRTGKWVWEPMPSERTPTFYKRHRFTLDEAQTRAAIEVPKLVINGMRWEDVLRLHEKRTRMA